MKLTISQNTHEFKYMSHTILFFFFLSFLKFFKPSSKIQRKCCGRTCKKIIYTHPPKSVVRPGEGEGGRRRGRRREWLAYGWSSPHSVCSASPSPTVSCHLLKGRQAGSTTVEQAGPAKGSATSPSSSVHVPFSGL